MMTDMNDESDCTQCKHSTTNEKNNTIWCDKKEHLVTKYPVCEQFKYQENKPRPDLVTAGSIIDATSKYHKATVKHIQKIEEINEERNKTLTEYTQSIREYLKHNDQEHITDIRVDGNQLIIELEDYVAIAKSSMHVLEHISTNWYIQANHNSIEVHFTLWDVWKDGDIGN